MYITDFPQRKISIVVLQSDRCFPRGTCTIRYVDMHVCMSLLCTTTDAVLRKKAAYVKSWQGSYIPHVTYILILLYSIWNRFPCRILLKYCTCTQPNKNDIGPSFPLTSLRELKPDQRITLLTIFCAHTQNKKGIMASYRPRIFLYSHGVLMYPSIQCL